MNGVLQSWLIIVNLLFYSKCESQSSILEGVATFPSITEQNVPLKLIFTQHVFKDQAQDQVKLKPSFKRNFEWKIHKLPVQMGHSACELTTVGDCFECNIIVSPNPNNEPLPTQLTCLSGKFDLNTQLLKLPRCARLSSQNGLIGRSVIVIEEDKSTSARSKTVHCATIFKSDFKDQFSGTIAWFQKPYAGFVAFRVTGSSFQSYILGNLTRVTAWGSTSEKFNWAIEENRMLSGSQLSDDCILNPSGKYECVYNPLNKNMHSDAYSTDCTHLSQFGCAQGDLTKKHNPIELDNTKPNLLLLVDKALAVDKLLHKQLVLYKTIDNGAREVVSSSPIENIQPISVDVTFKDKSILRLMQRDPWSEVMYTYTPSSDGDGWKFTIHKVPTVHICSGELWNCHMWTNVALEPEDGFKATTEQKSLGQRFTLYGRDSIMYHGVIMKAVRGGVQCSTITYKQEDERIGYTKLSNTIDQSGERAIAILVQHATFRQTTVLIASKCQDYSMPLYLSLSNDSTCRATELYNPHNVCPADCSAGQCGNTCGEPCCTNCAPHSSSLCPLGDLKSRFGTFLQVSTKYRRGMNLELVWSVMNDLDLPLNDMVNRKLGLKIAQQYDHDTLARCGTVRRLRQTQVKVQLAGGATLTLSQNATWQPLTVSWTLQGRVTLTFWKTPGFSDSVCRHIPEKLGSPHSSDEAGNTRSMILPLDSTRKSFFGPYSILGCSLTVEYTGSGDSVETTTVDLLPKGDGEQTHNVQAVLLDEPLGAPQIVFDLMQRADHLTEETYIKVTILDARLCNSDIVYKWYIVKNSTLLSKGDVFEVKDEKDSRFFGSDQEECTYDTLKSGDLSGKLGDLKLDGAGHQYIDPYIPVKSVVGHYLLLTHPNNSVVASLLLQLAPKREPETPVSASQHNNVPWIVGVVVVIAIVIITIFICCCLYIHKGTICLKPSKQATQRYDPVDPVKPVEPQYEGLIYKFRRSDGSECGPVKVIGWENKYLSTMRVQHLYTMEEDTVVLKHLVELSEPTITKEELENYTPPPASNGYNTHIQTAGCIVSNGAQGYPREPRVVIKKKHPYPAPENLYSKLPVNGITQDPVSYTDYRFRRTSNSIRSDSSLSGASISS